MAWSHRLWQVHERRQRQPSRLTYIWPTPAVIHVRWNAFSAQHLVDAIAWILSASRGEEAYLWDHWAHIDPPPQEHQPWRDVYAQELADFPVIAWALVQENPFRAIAKRARLSLIEQEVARAWFNGSSLADIARSLGRREQTVEVMVERIEDKLVRLVEPYLNSIAV